MKKYYKNRYCIYLDQFAVSNLCEDHADWIEIKELLIKGVSTSKLFCPLSTEHLLETSAKTEANAILQHNYFLSLSEGYCLRIEPFITAQLLISIIRQNNITYNTFLSNKIKPTFSYKDSLTQFRSNRNDLTSMINEVVDPTNEFKATQRNKKVSIAARNGLMATHKFLNTEEFINRLQELITTKGIHIRAVEFETRRVAHWIDYILDILLKIHKMNSKEAKMLFEHLKKHGFNHISCLDVRTTMEAYSAVMQTSQSVNDQIDILRIASGIQIADIMLTDKQRKFELTETGLADKYQTKIFCGTRGDIIAFAHELRSLCNT